MEEELVREKITSFLVDVLECPKGSISDEATLIEDLEIDSISTLELMVYVEDDLGVNIEKPLRSQLKGPDRLNTTFGWLISLICTTSMKDSGVHT